MTVLGVVFLILAALVIIGSISNGLDRARAASYLAERARQERRNRR